MQYSPPCQPQDQVVVIKEEDEEFLDDFSSDLRCLPLPNHMFVGYPIEMTYESRVLFDLCKSRQLAFEPGDY